MVMNQPLPPLAPDDPIMIRRARYALATSWGKRLGYSLYLVAIAAFVVGLVTSFANGSGWLMIAALLIGSAFLLPAIIFGYAVKAAERHDLGLSDGH